MLAPQLDPIDNKPYPHRADRPNPLILAFLWIFSASPLGPFHLWYLPPQFKDLNGVAVWMSFSNVFNMIDMNKVQEHFSKIF